MQTIVCNSRRTRLLLTLIALTTLVGFGASCSRAGSAPTKVSVIGEASLKGPSTLTRVCS